MSASTREETLIESLQRSRKVLRELLAQLADPSQEPPRPKLTLVRTEDDDA